jgi:hypothetical protein
MEDLDEIADLETKLLGSIDRSSMEMGTLPLGGPHEKMPFF